MTLTYSRSAGVSLKNSDSIDIRNCDSIARRSSFPVSDLCLTYSNVSGGFNCGLASFIFVSETWRNDQERNHDGPTEICLACELSHIAMPVERCLCVWCCDLFVMILAMDRSLRSTVNHVSMFGLSMLWQIVVPVVFIGCGVAGLVPSWAAGAMAVVFVGHFIVPELFGPLPLLFTVVGSVWLLVLAAGAVL